MASQGQLSPSAAANDGALGAIAWLNPTNILSSDDSRATAVLLITQQSNYLKATGFGANIPADAIIDGYQFDVEKSGSILSAAQDAVVKTLQAGAVVGNDKSAGGTWGSSDAVVSYGGATDLWGWVPTPADINNANFGLALSASALLGVTAQVDSVKLTVWYHGSNKPGINRRGFKASGLSISE